MLKNLWQELGHYQCIETWCLWDAIILKNCIQKDRVYDFFVGLNAKFDQVRVQILSKELPTLNERRKQEKFHARTSQFGRLDYGC